MIKTKVIGIQRTSVLGRRWTTDVNYLKWFKNKAVSVHYNEHSKFDI